MIQELSIGGAFCHFETIKSLFLKNYLKLKNKVTVFDGFNDSVWNGCRTYLEAPTEFSEDQLKIYNKLGIGVYFTFSNNIIDITLKEENTVLKILNKSKLNGVIIRNEDLRKHIRKNYPNLKILFSVSGFTSLDFSNIKDYESKYDLVCPRYEWVFNKDFYSKINKNKYKIMLNDTCKFGCTLWEKHFNLINQLIREKCQDRKIIDKARSCWIGNEKNNPSNGWGTDIEKYGINLGMDLNNDALANALKIGYSRFKFSGREFSEVQFNEEITEYLNKILYFL